MVHEDHSISHSPKTASHMGGFFEAQYLFGGFTEKAKEQPLIWGLLTKDTPIFAWNFVVCFGSPCFNSYPNVISPLGHVKGNQKKGTWAWLMFWSVQHTLFGTIGPGPIPLRPKAPIAAIILLWAHRGLHQNWGNPKVVFFF